MPVVSRIRTALDLLARPARHRYGPHRSQVADLHLPRTPGPHPVAVVIHGGSWQQRYGRVVTRPLAVDLTRRGWAAWNIEYRRVGAGGGWPETLEDVATAIDTLTALDAPLALDRVVVVGHSAGGQLALWAAGRERLPRDAPGAGPRLALTAAVSLAGVNDLAGAYRAVGGDGGSVGAFMGGGPDELPERYAVTDPIALVPLPLPVLLVHGTEDAMVSVRHSREYVRAATLSGADARLVEISGPAGTHRSHINPDGEGWGVARDWLSQRAERPGRAHAA